MRRLTHFSIICLWVYYSLPCQGQIQLTPSNNKGSVKFQIKNFGLIVDGFFEGVTGKILWDNDAIENSSFDISLDASTVSTGIALRDRHLRKTDYLDVTTYPFIRFKSTKIYFTKMPGIFVVEGKLIIKEKTKIISFPFSVDLNKGYVFSGQFVIDRREYGVGGKSLSLSDDVMLSLTIHTTKRS